MQLQQRSLCRHDKEMSSVGRSVGRSYVCGGRDVIELLTPGSKSHARSATTPVASTQGGACKTVCRWPRTAGAPPFPPSGPCSGQRSSSKHIVNSRRRPRNRPLPAWGVIEVATHARATGASRRTDGQTWWKFNHVFCTHQPSPTAAAAAAALEHWLLDCSALTPDRSGIFGLHDLSLDVLFTSPHVVISLAGRCTLFWGSLWFARHRQQQQQHWHWLDSLALVSVLTHITNVARRARAPAAAVPSGIRTQSVRIHNNSRRRSAYSAGCYLRTASTPKVRQGMVRI